MDYFTKKVLLNHQIFMEKLLANPEFFLEILDWQNKLRITDKNLGNFFSVKKEVYIEAHKYGTRLLNKIRETENVEFLRWLDNFCIKYQFGNIWKRPILHYIACGYYCPPETSIDVDLDKKRNVVTLELGAYTTKEDFERAWSNAKEKLKKLPKRNSRKFSAKSFESLQKILMANKIRHEDGLKGLDLVGRLYQEAEDITEKADKRRKNKLKIAQQRLRKRGYTK